MKRSDLSKILGTSALAISLAVIPSVLPASAQTNTNPNNDRSLTVDTTPFQEANNDYKDGNWGLLGLLGLIGLAGRFRKDEPTVVNRDSVRDDVVSGPGSRM